jgi:hypothetical protein
MDDNPKPPRKRPAHLFKPGQSGNPGGRPKEVMAVRELARRHTADAVRALVEIARNKKAQPAARVAAANAILDRGYGRVEQNLNVTGDTVLQVITGIMRSPNDPILITDATDVADDEPADESVNGVEVSADAEVG